MKRNELSISHSLPVRFIANKEISSQKTPSDRLYLLLHGYSEDASKIFTSLVDLLPNEKGLIIAPDAPFPLPRNFPLHRSKKTDQHFFKGHAWYFYDPAHDHFLVDYAYPAQILTQFLRQIDPEQQLSTTIIGHSQGGYLAPFVAQQNPRVDHIIGINCSYRTQRLRSFPPIRLDSIHAQGDKIVDPHLAQQRHKELIQGGCSGEFILVESDKHRLTPSLLDPLLHLISSDRENPSNNPT